MIILRRPIAFHLEEKKDESYFSLFFFSPFILTPTPNPFQVDFVNVLTDPAGFAI